MKTSNIKKIQTFLHACEEHYYQWFIVQIVHRVATPSLHKLLVFYFESLLLPTVTSQIIKNLLKCTHCTIHLQVKQVLTSLTLRKVSFLVALRIFVKK